jgi:hypothetical protein
MAPWALAVALALAPASTSALTCVTQQSGSASEWAASTVNCSTFCLIAYARTTLVADFEQPNAVCLGAGCAVLKADGSVDLEASVLGSGNSFPIYGKSRVLKCDNSSFTGNAEQLQAQYPDSCNLYANLTSPRQLCQQLLDATVADIIYEPSFWEKNKFKFVVGGGALGALLFLLLCFVLYRRSADRRGEQSAAVGARKADAELGSGEEQARAAEASSSPAADPEERKLALIPPQFVPGSAMYEKYHAALSELFRANGGDVNKVDKVLVDYLSKPNGVELLNEKLTHKFSKELKQIAKAQGGPALPSKRDEEISTQSFLM